MTFELVANEQTLIAVRAPLFHEDTGQYGELTMNSQSGYLCARVCSVLSQEEMRELGQALLKAVEAVKTDGSEPAGEA
jgi:hypothetical protein